VPRALATTSLALGAFTFVVWIANALEVRVLRPTQCSIERLQFESWLLVARAAAMVAPLLGLASALLAFGAPPRRRNAALAMNTLALAFVALIVARLVPLGHLPCLRD
jgi:hypothetical protein